MTNLAVTIFAGFAQFFVTWLTALGHFETKSDAYRCASIGLILLQELTF
jgi:hypothetical protein